MVFNKYNHLLATTCTKEAFKISIEVSKITDPMTGEDSYEVPAPYDREKNDTCDYVPPQASLSISGSNIIENNKKGSYDYNYSLFINGVEQSGISIGRNGVVSGYTLNGSESSVKIMVTDSAGYTVVDEKKLTPVTVDDQSGN